MGGMTSDSPEVITHRPGRLMDRAEHKYQHDLPIHLQVFHSPVFSKFQFQFQFQSPELFLFIKRDTSTWRFVVDFTMHNTRALCGGDCDGVDWKFALWLSYKITMKLTHDAVQSWS